MKNKVNFKYLLQFLVYYFLVYLGFTIISYFIYFRFLRTRVPHEIPFILMEWGFYSLIFICLVYLYTIKIILNPPVPTSLKISIIFYLRKAFTPFTTFDSYLKERKIIQPIYDRFLNKLIPILHERVGYFQKAMLFISFKLIPRIILVSIFLGDIFIVGKLEIFYYFVIMGIFPLLYDYFNYSLYMSRENYLQQLEGKYYQVLLMDKSSQFKSKWPETEKNPEAIYHDEMVSIREYFQIRLENTYYLSERARKEITWDELEQYKQETVEYYGIPFAHDAIVEHYMMSLHKNSEELVQEDYDKMDKEFYLIEKNLLLLNLYLDLDKKTSSSYYIPRIKIVIYVLYLIGWCYILIKSFHTLKTWSMTLTVLHLLTSYGMLIEPFSETFL